MARPAIAGRAIDLIIFVTFGDVKEKLEFYLEFGKPADCVIHNARDEIINRSYLYLAESVDGCDACEANRRISWLKRFWTIVYAHCVEPLFFFAHEVEPAEKRTVVLHPVFLLSWYSRAMVQNSADHRVDH